MMGTPVQPTLPWQHSWSVSSWQHVLLLTLDYHHPCSVQHGTGKLNFNIIYSRCRHDRLQGATVVILIYILGKALLNYLQKALFSFLLGFPATPSFFGRFCGNFDKLLRFIFDQLFLPFSRYKSSKGGFADNDKPTFWPCFNQEALLFLICVGRKDKTRWPTMMKF